MNSTVPKPMTEIFSPSNIEFLLHCYCKPEPHPRFDCEAIQECFKEFIDMGVIKQDGDHYVTTPLGNAWVYALCKVKCPTPAFIDEHGRIVK